MTEQLDLNFLKEVPLLAILQLAKLCKHEIIIIVI